MSEKPRKSGTDWIDPDDAPEWTPAMFERAEIAEGGRILRPATGTVARSRARPKLDTPRKQVTLRLSDRVIEHFRATGPGWQRRIEEALLKAIDG